MFTEIIGITLAYIEIRYKPFANRIESRIIDSEDNIKEFAYKLLDNKFFSALITLFVIVIFFFEIPYFAGFFDEVLPPDLKGLQNTLLWLTTPVVILFILSLCTIFFSEFVGWLNRFSEGHAIGALGVVITSIGLLGEIYQVLTILYGSK